MSTAVAPLMARRSMGWSVLLSIVMIVAGLLAIALPPVAGLAVNIFLGWMLVFSAGAHFLYAWQARKTSGVWGEILLGVLYAIVGIFLLINPVAGLLSLTLVLAAYLFIEAILEIYLSFRLRPLRGTGWLLFDGIFTLILAFMIWRTWPWSTEWAIGILVGISMLFSGIARLMPSISAYRIAPKIA